MKFARWISLAAGLVLAVSTASYGQVAADAPRESTFSLLDLEVPTPAPTPPPDLRLSLKQAIDVALEQNPTLRQAREDLETAEANFDLAHSPYRTLIDLNGTASTQAYKIHEIAGSTVLNPTRSAQEGQPVYDYRGRHGSRGGDREEIGLRQALSKTFRNATRLQFETREAAMHDSLRFYDDDQDQNEDLQSSASVSYTIPFNSRQRLSIRTDLENAELSYQQALNNLYQERETIIYMSTADYWNLKLNEAEVQISRDDLAQRRRTYEYYQIHFEFGFAPELDVKQSRVSMREAEASLLALEAAVQNRYEDFNLLLGLPVDHRLELTDTLDVPELARTPEEYVEQVLATNLQLKNTRLGLNQQENRLAVTRLGQQPSVELVSSFQRDDGGDSFANFQFQVMYPFGDGGATKARVRASESRIQQQEIGIWNLERSLRQQVMQLLRDVDTARRQLEINRERERLSTEALDTANFRFENGEISFRDLQDAQLDLASSRYTLARTIASLNVSVANLESLIHEY